MDVTNGKYSGANKKGFRRFLTRSRSRKIILVIISIAILQIAVIFGSIYYGMMLHKSGSARSIAEFTDGLVISKFNVLGNYIKGMTSDPKNIRIDIQHLDFQQLAYKRQTALDLGKLIVTEDDYVPATISYGNESVGARIRLKGDWIEHLLGDKWSFRIKIRGENTLFGMKQFSLHHPHTRDYLNEWIYHEALKREDIISLRYDFVTVTVNGKDLGVYALEEHFEKRLIESNKFREGPIIRFDEDIFWGGNAFPSYQVRDDNTYLTSNIDMFQTNKYLHDSTYRKQFISGMNLLQAWRQGSLKTSDVFDTKKLAKFTAISDLLGAHHGLRWHNRRFYYNPITSILEPIGFDSGAGKSITSVCYTEQRDSVLNRKFQEGFFRDTSFLRVYIHELERIAQTSYLDSLFVDLKDGYKYHLRTLYKEFPYYIFNTEFFYKNQEQIRAYLNPDKALHAYLNKVDSNRINLKIGNIQLMPVEVLDVCYHDSVVFLPDDRIMLLPEISPSLVELKDVSFTMPINFTWSDTYSDSLIIHYQIYGTETIQSENIYPWTPSFEDFENSDLVRQMPNPEEFDFLRIDNDNAIITVTPGQWQIDRDLIIPSGYTFTCGPGTQIDLVKSAMIMSYSPLRFTGTEEQQIMVYLSDSTGQGMLVFANNVLSILTCVVFDDLAEPSRKYWNLTGAVTFYESPVEIQDCVFQNNSSEDGLNIIRSQFTITNSLFTNTFSDAFDADFCAGSVIETSFFECGNDALDVSGSVVELSQIKINQAGDKGISVGEDSRMKASDVEIKNCNIGVASKDMSELELNNAKLYGCNIGLAVYQKKPEFGPALINASGLSIEEIEKPYIVETNSRIIANGEEIDSNIASVAEIIN